MTMKYNAEVTYQAALPAEVERIAYAEFEGRADAYATARMVAEWAAERRYGETAMATHMEQIAENKFRVFVGAYDGGGGTTGTTLTITLIAADAVAAE